MYKNVYQNKFTHVANQVQLQFPLPKNLSFLFYFKTD